MCKAKNFINNHWRDLVIIALVIILAVMFVSCKKETASPLNQVTFDNRSLYWVSFNFKSLDTAISIRPENSVYMSRTQVVKGKACDLIGEEYTLEVYHYGKLKCSYEAVSSKVNLVDTNKCK